ncbi:MAG: hypothetical protein M3R13_05030 [Armatimonadota bacterium]|nr:hypothetical protein [Armatimonadota bacterium]
MPTTKTRAGVWFVVAVAAVIGAWFGSNELYTRFVILPREYPTLEPGNVSLIGLKVPGYHIVVSNGVARLQIGAASQFGKPADTDSGSGSAVPMRGLIGALRFDPEAAAELVTALNGIKHEIEPLRDRVWTKERIEQVIASNAVESGKLEYDLATRLDGRGIDRISWDRLTTGIWLEVPVPIGVPAANGKKTVVANVLIPYKTRLAVAASNYFQRLLERGGLGDDLNPTAATISGVYNQALDDGESAGFEDVAASLRSQFSAEAIARLADPVQKLLNEVEVLVTEKTIKSAELKSQRREDGDGEIYSIVLEVAAESRDRLWQYTYERPGSQLLLVSNGVAIGAPVVQHEIKYSTVEITGVAEQKLAEEALAFIESATAKNLP